MTHSECVGVHPAFHPVEVDDAMHCVMFSSSVIFLLVDACVGLNWLLVSFLSHVNKNIIHSFIHASPMQSLE